MKVLSLFTGAGGLDLGLERAGFEIAGCVELDDDCQSTIGANRPNWKCLQPGDVHAHRPVDVLTAFGLKPGDVTLLAGGPPCQPFSKSGQWKNGAAKRMGDPRALTLRAYLDILEAALPDAMLLENVKGIIATRKQVTHRYEGLDVLRSALGRINRKHKTSYDLIPFVLDAADYGVPQHRQRVFVYAARDGSGLTLPSPTHGFEASANGRAASSGRYATAWDALYDLDDPEFDDALLPGGKWAGLLPSIPEGSNYLHHTARGGGEPLFGWRRRYWSFLLKLAKGLPSWTIQAQAGPATGPFHWRSRRLTVREIARLQCFPDDWTMAGSTTSACRQLGNAVPPPIGELLGFEIRRQLSGGRVRRKTPLIPMLRDDCPGPEPIEAVPRSYLRLKGQQEDHPGPGLGPGALRARKVAEQS
jgi:DNA (cytosine-5)-methyltransferase 1